MYTFLEDAVGCRWWTSTESLIPNRPTLEIPEIHISYAPKLISREAFYRDAFGSPFAPRLKLNGHFMEIPREFGGHMPIRLVRGDIRKIAGNPRRTDRPMHWSRIYDD